MFGLDFETFGEVNLPDRGLHNYVNHHSFRPLMASLVHLDDKRAPRTERYDFITGGGTYPSGEDARKAFLHAMSYPQIAGSQVVAHNAGFERAVLNHMGAQIPESFVIDSAVVARAYGAAGKLEAAAPQLVGGDKLDVGMRLIKKFSMPQEDGYVYIDHVEDWSEEDWDDWELFGHYCDIDALRGVEIATFDNGLYPEEHRFELLTHRMNTRGWPVDLDLVLNMQEQYHRNLELIEQRFHEEFTKPGEEPLNFRSTTQLRKWVAARGINMKSFDEQAVEKAITRISNRAVQLASTASPDDPRHQQLYEVLHMLRTKQELGGSSLSKLKKILDLVSADGRLRDQYLHVGAGQSFRTSGRGVQMQNLKRLGSEIGDVEGDLTDWTNSELARNLRQVFCASHEDGYLIVGDFSSVESRGLAYLAGAEWKLDAFHQGKDMYKVLASSMLGVPYDQVDKGQRQTGKVGELSCGYGAGPKAVRDFAEKMGVVFSEEEATEIVNGWRETNPEVVTLWRMLDDALHDVVEKGLSSAQVVLGPPEADLMLVLSTNTTPASITKQKPDAKTLRMTVYRHGKRMFSRWFQGCYMDGKQVCYLKPSELKGGELWREWWTKDGQRGRYTLYGGKLSGILTQSFCREIFFNSMAELELVSQLIPNVSLIGQFHDELILEWKPPTYEDGSVGLDQAMELMEQAMTTTSLPNFPLEADIKFDRRYTK